MEETRAGVDTSEKPTDFELTPRGRTQAFGWWVPIGCVWVFLALNLIAIREYVPELEREFDRALLPMPDGAEILLALLNALGGSYWIVGGLGLLITLFMLVSRHLALGSSSSRWIGTTTVTAIVGGIYPLGRVFKTIYEAEVYLGEKTQDISYQRSWWDIQSPWWDLTFIVLILTVALLCMQFVLRQKPKTQASA